MIITCVHNGNPKICLQTSAGTTYLPVSCSYYREKGQGSLKRHSVQKKITCLAKSSQEIFEKYPDLMYNVAKNKCGNISLPPPNSPLLGLCNSMGHFSFYFNYLHYKNMKKKKKINNYNTLRIQIK